jgi:hypothetical protein
MRPSPQPRCDVLSELGSLAAYRGRPQHPSPCSIRSESVGGAGRPNRTPIPYLSRRAEDVVNRLDQVNAPVAEAVRKSVVDRVQSVHSAPRC